MKKIATLLFVGFSAVLFSAERLDTFDYRLASYPKNNETCENAGKTVSAEFQSGTGLIVDSVDTSENEDKTSCEIIILYRAEKRIRVYSTAPTLPSIIKGSVQGMYLSRNECEANASEQVALFEKLTGLKAVLTYCFADSSIMASFSGQTTYALRIDGFGQAKLVPFIGNLQLEPSMTEAATVKTLAQVQSYLEAKGAVVAKIMATPNGTSLKVLPPTLVVLYYAPKVIPLSPY